MKFVIVLTLALAASSCCPIKETTRTTVTTTDSSITPPTTEGQVSASDGSDVIREWLNNELERVRLENDSLRSHLPADIEKEVVRYVPTRFPPHTWTGFKVTQRGDSLWVSFRYDNGNGTFTYKEVPAPIIVKLRSTDTERVVEKQPAWHEALWIKFKDVLLFGMIIILSASLLWRRIKPF